MSLAKIWIVHLCFLTSYFALSSAKIENKISLTFAIDNTCSMGDDIDAVKKSAGEIFDTVTNSKASHVEDFVLVTFNDPGVQHRITTKDKNEYRNALSQVYVTACNWDCPEMSMAGIELAITKSRPGSLLYVFTDASAKDADKHEVVKNLALKYQIQVVFGLTGECYGPEAAYYNLAKETGGEVFNVEKEELPNMLDWVKKQINSKKEVIISKSFPPGSNKEQVKVDSKMKELIISVSGNDPSVAVWDPTGAPAKPSSTTKITKAILVSISEIKPGTYTIEVSSSSVSTLKVSADTDLHFEHGFSIYKPTSIGDTATRPIPDEPSYLSIKLSADGTDNFVLDAVQILDLDSNNVVAEGPVKLIDIKNKFYISKNTIIPPNKLFRVAIQGHDLNTKENITRISLSPIEPQNKVTTTSTKVPEVKLVGDNKIDVDNNDPVILTCKVSGYPKPKVVWENSDGNIITAGVTYDPVEPPYDYLTTLKINQVTSTTTYHCVARNDYGGDSKTVEVVRKTYFNIVKTPRGMTVELYREAQFECKVEAYPPAEIRWYQNNREVVEDRYYKMSDDRTVLTIRKMQLHNVGGFKCVVRNTDIAKQFLFNVDISGVEPPKIDKKVREIHVQEGDNVEFPCKVTRGNPKPEIQWAFIDDDGVEHSIHASSNAEVLKLERVTRKNIHSGLYRCVAKNDVSYDYHNIQLFIDHPPMIAGDSVINIEANEGDRVDLPCRVEGEPEPSVQWYRDGARLDITTRHMLNWNGLSFYPGLDDSGKYTCEASNKYGSVNKIINLGVYRPPFIKIPAKSKQIVRVGKELNLECIADGYPKPRIDWIFYGTIVNGPQKPIKYSSNGPLKFSFIQTSQEGFYRCIAENIRGSYSITYEVEVQAPPFIMKNPTNEFKAVVGDKALRIPCNASGKPKPEIFWEKELETEFLKLPAGSDWYEIESSGTLVIKDVDKNSAGSYRCKAYNSVGNHMDYNEVTVEDYPTSKLPEKRIVLEKGSIKALVCDVPHTITDSVRWFKDGINISNNSEHYIMNAQRSDSGVYTCRVSNFYKSRSGGSVRVVVGMKPEFLYKAEENINFNEGNTAFMDCEASGVPEPKVSWWHDRKKLSFEEMNYTPTMNISNLGEYYCVVENDFGEIKRTFNIITQDCILNTENGLLESQPLIIESYHGVMTWPKLQSTEGFLRIPAGKQLILKCPKTFKIYRRKATVLAKCVNNFLIDAKNKKFSELECSDPVTPKIQKTNTICVKNNINTNLVNIGYDYSGKLLDVYKVCVDTEAKAPLYTIHNIDRTLADVEPKSARWYPNNIVNYNIDDVYDCESQYKRIYPTVSDKCCFSKRFLVNPRDVAPGLQQLATYSTLNLVPQWSSCNTQNWESVERRVRKLAKSTTNRLIVWTGVSQDNAVSTDMGGSINIPDASGHLTPVAKYLWKVILEPSSSASVAIIQLNTPGISMEEANMQMDMLCPDVCDQVTWMASDHWRDVSRGFTFCCKVLDFQRSSGYWEVFRGVSRKLLNDVSLLPNHHLVT